MSASVGVGVAFNVRDFDILNFLADHPTSSMEDAARSLNCRPETVSTHIRSLKERGIYTGTMGLLSYQKLGLAYIPVLVRTPIERIETLYGIVRSHPYIHYSVRTIGSNDGAFLVFIQPQNAVHLLLEFLDELAGRGIITDYRFFTNAESKRSFLGTHLELFNLETGNWDFDWNGWQSDENSGDPATNGGQLQTQTQTLEIGLHSLDKSDVELLRMISDDAKLPTEELARQANLLAHTVRRRIQRLEEEGFIIGYRAMVAYSKFHLSSSILFDCNARPNWVELCRKKLLTLPFSGTFIPVQNGFLFQIALPPQGLSPVQEFLARTCNNVEISWVDLPSSDVALFNSTAMADGAWRVTPDFLIKEPLRHATIE